MHLKTSCSIVTGCFALPRLPRYITLRIWKEMKLLVVQMDAHFSSMVREQLRVTEIQTQCTPHLNAQSKSQHTTFFNCSY
jgi:hypothetical protein